ncbi:uncharacterized protein G2W53_021860 [Senna tora]|uniref:Uncharacterized protein n=1 Tax=Senna tora TaxID=362788 RepID=A0A834WLH6_9FABA|nr:uncharacterized protein G2W53_021860 [Senna tora]
MEATEESLRVLERGEIEVTPWRRKASETRWRQQWETEKRENAEE